MIYSGLKILFLVTLNTFCSVNIILRHFYERKTKLLENNSLVHFFIEGCLCCSGDLRSFRGVCSIEVVRRATFYLMSNLCEWLLEAYQEITEMITTGVQWNKNEWFSILYWGGFYLLSHIFNYCCWTVLCILDSMLLIAIAYTLLTKS